MCVISCSCLLLSIGKLCKSHKQHFEQQCACNILEAFRTKQQKHLVLKDVLCSCGVPLLCGQNSQCSKCTVGKCNVRHIKADKNPDRTANLDDVSALRCEVPPADRALPTGLHMQGCLVVPCKPDTKGPAAPHSLQNQSCSDLLDTMPAFAAPPCSLPNNETMKPGLHVCYCSSLLDKLFDACVTSLFAAKAVD